MKIRGYIIILFLLSIIGILSGFLFSLFQKINILKKRLDNIASYNANIDYKIKKIKKYEQSINKLLNRNIILDIKKNKNNNLMNFVFFDYNIGIQKYIDYLINEYNLLNKSKKIYFLNLLKKEQKKISYTGDVVYISIYTKDTYKKIMLTGNIVKNIKNKIYFTNTIGDKLYLINNNKIMFNNNYNWGIIHKKEIIDKTRFRNDLDKIKYYRDIRSISLLIQKGYYNYYKINILKVFYSYNKKILTPIEKKTIFKLNFKNIPIDDSIKNIVLQNLEMFFNH